MVKDVLGIINQSINQYILFQTTRSIATQLRERDRQTETKKTDYIETNIVVNFSLPQHIVTAQNTALKTQNYYYYPSYPSIHPSIIIINIITKVDLG